MDFFIQSVKTGIRLFIILIKKLIKSLRTSNEELNEECEICDLFDVKYAQLLSHVGHEPLEWIPYDRFYDVKYVAKGGFGIVYRANWIDGYVDEWDDENQKWKRKGQNKFVALKSLNNSKNVTSEFMNEAILHHKVNNVFFIIRLYGVTKDPETENIMMVLDYAEDGSLKNYLNKNHHNLKWETKIDYLHNIAFGLELIHEKGLIHRDLHIGNILHMNREGRNTYITDMGLCKPADYDYNASAENSVYGVLPYIAPEILRHQNYTKAADIYSFGIIMYEIISGLSPYHDVDHDDDLARKICLGRRPSFNIKVPQMIVDLIKRCLDANPLNRPSAKEIHGIFEISDNQELQMQIEKNQLTVCL
ncbi:kinase-like domain-containing protein [Rhizophagus clarus]|uniref:Kinase-like domain-containing protein n=1 Tax=Rhizophagus clarus TaxID=94130 RepID=A0A8H3QNQ5_9GLOM|nr:kinase-like domain-containing protein [Rhizophagus clarus]